MSFYDRLKDKILSLFSTNKKEKVPETTETKKLLPNQPDIESSSLCSILDEQEHKNNAILRRKYLEVTTYSNKTNKLSTLSVLYFVLNLSLVAFLITLKVINNLDLKSDFKFASTVIPNFFQLKAVSSIVFNVLTLISALVGLTIIISVYLIAKNDREAKIIKTNKLSFYFTLLFGVISQLIQVIIGYEVFLTEVKHMNVQLSKEFNIKIEEILFITYVLIFELFALFATLELHHIQVTNVRNYETKENSTSYKIITLLYLFIFSFIYFFVYLHMNDLIGMKLANMKVLDTYYNIILAVFPYLIHVMIGIFMLTFYNDLYNFSFGIYSRKPQSEQLYDDNNKYMY